MAAKLTRLTHKTAIQLDLMVECCTTCSSRSRRPVRKLLDIPSCVCIVPILHFVFSPLMHQEHIITHGSRYSYSVYECLEEDTDTQMHMVMHMRSTITNIRRKQSE